MPGRGFQDDVDSAFVALLKPLHKSHPDLPKDPRTIMRSKKELPVQMIAGGSYYHFGIASGLSTVIDEVGVAGCCINLQVNIDGLPLFKSTSGQFWPILGLVSNCSKQKPFIIGLFYGNAKPTSAEQYLRQFLTESEHMQENGFLHNHTNYVIKLKAVVCDTPARAFVKNIKGHSGYQGCDKCSQDGVAMERRMTFPETEECLRTDMSFRMMVDEDHHLGPFSVL